MKYPQARLIQFARYPELGKVKTRLSPHLDDKNILDLYRKLVARTYNTLKDARLAPVTIFCSDAKTDSDGFFAQMGATDYCHQRGVDLGERMYNAFVQTLAPAGSAQMVVLVGSDCPFLSDDIVDEALAALASGADSVFGPAVDGGYYLIGLRRVEWTLFESIPWGTARVYGETLRRLRNLGWRNHQLKILADIDRPADLAVLDEIPLFFQN